MATWGTSAFDNDTACEWLEDIDEDGYQAIRNRLWAVSSKDYDAYPSSRLECARALPYIVAGKAEAHCKLSFHEIADVFQTFGDFVIAAFVSSIVREEHFAEWKKPGEYAYDLRQDWNELCAVYPVASAYTPLVDAYINAGRRVISTYVPESLRPL